MLALPECGMNYSVKKHNIDIDVLCDWIEASILFEVDEISKSDVVDVLIENEVYVSQDFAGEVVDIAWAILKERLKLPSAEIRFSITGNRIERANTWDSFPAYAFCLAVTCASYLYPDWAKEYGHDSATQGSLFERVTLESLQRIFPSWTIRRVGWAPDNPVRLKDAVGEILADLNEMANNDIDLHVTDNANELGLDLLAFCSFDDQHASFPIVMVQCASGKDWVEKRHTPDLTVWRKIVNFNSQPLKAFAIPYSFTDAKDFRKNAAKVDGLFIDRYRLLVPKAGKALCDMAAELNADLLAWIRPRVEALPRGDI